MYVFCDLDCMYSNKSLRVFQNSYLVLTADGIAVNNLETGFMEHLSYPAIMLLSRTLVQLDIQYCSRVTEDPVLHL
jgi:hypothetical protein